MTTLDWWLRPPGLWAWSLPLLALLLVLVGWLIWRRRTAMRRRLRAAIDAISYGVLRDIFLPDGMDGHIHLDYLLLTETGLLVLDVKDVQGAIFGAAKMDQWAVMQGTRRYTFRNPLGPLTEKVGAIKALARNVAVEGLIVFLPHGEFPKGLPEHSCLLEDLGTRVKIPAWTPDAVLGESWEQIRALAQPAKH